jgi:RND superfamily putative drug exporter
MLLQRVFDVLCGRRGKFLALAFWIVLVSIAGPLAVKATEVQDNDQLSALPADAESQRAADRVRTAFPEPDTLVAVVVYARDGGLTAADRTKLDTDRAALAPFAAGPIAPAVPSDDGQALLLSFGLTGDDNAQSAAVDRIRDQLAANAPPGLRTALTGSAGASSDIFDAFEGMDGALLLAAGLAVALLLIITYRSPVLWLVPILTVGVASQVASGVVYLLGVTVDLQSQSIQTILVFGVGVDYALLIIARYREELRRRADRHAAMAVAVRRCLPAITASAATVGLALLCLLATDLPATRGLGIVSALGVLIAFLAMATLLPAILVLLGRWVFWPFVPRVGDPVAHRGPWHRIAGNVARRPHTTWIATIVVLGALILGLGKLSIGLPNDEAFTQEVGSVTGQNLIEAHYPAGTIEPVDVLAKAASATEVAAAAAVTGVADVRPAEVSADNQWARISLVLSDAPDSDAAMQTVRRLRTAVHEVTGADALVGGTAAALVDSDATASHDTRVAIPLILLVVAGVLVLLLRSVLAPLLLLVSVVLSYGAAMGAAGLILSAWGHPRLWVALPLQTFLFLVALGVDYSIFLMTRAREETATRGHAGGIQHALSVTGGVITSAGIVLAATFSALCVLPLVPSVQTAVIVSVGVLLDTFLIRTLLVPALALVIGRRIWWPGRPDAARRAASPSRTDPELVSTP